MDIKQKVFAQHAAIYLLRAREDNAAGYEAITDIYDAVGGYGFLKKGWSCVSETSSHLTIDIAESKTVLLTTLHQVEAVAYSRGLNLDRTQEPYRVYSLDTVDFPEVFSGRVWRFHLEFVKDKWLTGEFGLVDEFFNLA